MQGALGQIGTILVTLLGLLVLTFIIGRMMPADPVRAMVGEDATRETYEQVFRSLGLDRPLWEQFFYYLGDVLTGNFGTSIRTGQPVIQDILHVMPATIELATFAILIGAGLGVPMGVIAAVNKDRWPDHVVRVLSLFGHSMPIFWTGMIALIVLYAKLDLVGGSGRMDQFYIGLVPETTGFLLIDSLLAGEMDVFWSAVNHLILPASLLGYSSSAYITRMTRSFMLDQLGQEYITTARVKGLSKHQTIWRHAFVNIRVQLVTIVALAYGSLLEGAVLIETVFAWPGIGRLMFDALSQRDYNLLLGVFVVSAAMVLLFNLITDVLYRLVDPRIKVAS